MPPQELLNTELVSSAGFQRIFVVPHNHKEIHNLYHRYWGFKGPPIDLGGATATRTQTTLTGRTD